MIISKAIISNAIISKAVLAGRNAAKPSQATGLTDGLAGRNAYPTDSKP
jgi:hypothetical protein